MQLARRMIKTADGQYLECLHHKIAEIVKKRPAYPVYLLFRLIRERITQVLQYYFFTVARTGIQHKKKEIRKQVQDRERQYRQQVNKW